MTHTENSSNHPRPNLFVSTNAFQTGDLRRIMKACLEENIPGLELSSNVPLPEDVLVDMEKSCRGKGLRFLIHNYFPAPDEAFVLNLASNDKQVLESSREHCREAVALCDRLEVPFYSVHAGFCFHAGPEDLGRPQRDLPRIPMETAENIFVESLVMLCDFADQFGIDIAVENNVLAPFNRVDGQNRLFLGVLSHELLRLRERVARKRLCFLLDVGHLKVSASSLDIDPFQQVKELAPFVKAVHLSDNDGQRDSNEKLTRQSWFWSSLKAFLDSSAFYVLEVGPSSAEEITGQLELVKKQVWEG